MILIWLKLNLSIWTADFKSIVISQESLIDFKGLLTFNHSFEWRIWFKQIKIMDDF